MCLTENSGQSQYRVTLWAIDFRDSMLLPSTFSTCINSIESSTLMKVWSDWLNWTVAVGNSKESRTKPYQARDQRRSMWSLALATMVISSIQSTMGQPMLTPFSSISWSCVSICTLLIVSGDRKQSSCWTMPDITSVWASQTHSDTWKSQSCTLGHTTFAWLL